MRVLHLSTWNDQCGIGGYAKNLIAALQQQPDVINDVYPPRRQQLTLMSDGALREVFDSFLVLASTADLVHLQHEHAFFAGRHGYARAVRQFGRLLMQLRQRDVPIVVTFHSEPTSEAFERPARTGTRVFGGARARLTSRYERVLWRWHVARHFRRGKGRRQAIVHTRRGRLALIESGFNPAQVQVVPPGHPRRCVLPMQERAQAKERLGFPKQATVLSLFGSVANHASYSWAVETLKTLPPSFVLAVVGGNPVSHDDEIVNAVLDSWKNQNPSRLRITGFVSPEMVDAYHAATDICLVPHLPCAVSASAALPWALTSGRPTIASDIPAFRYLNEDADCLLLAKPGDVGDLAARIRALAVDAPKQEDLVRRALAYASANGWDALAARHLEIYQALVHQPLAQPDLETNPHLDLAHTPRIAELFPGR